MDSVGIDRANVFAFAAALAAAGPAARGDAMRAVLAGAARVESTMRSIVPVESAETRDSIEIEVDEEPWGWWAEIGPTNIDDAGYPVAVAIEYGTSSQAPQPFVEPSARAHEVEFVRAMSVAGQQVF